MPIHLHAHDFTAEWLPDGASYAGFSDGTLDGGSWELPFFTKEVADQYVASLPKRPGPSRVGAFVGGLQEITYDADRDRYVVVESLYPDEPDAITYLDGLLIGGQHVYPFGNLGWTWEIVGGDRCWHKRS